MYNPQVKIESDIVNSWTDEEASLLNDTFIKLLESLPIATGIFDVTNVKWVFVNKRIESIYGFRRSELLKKSENWMRAIIHPYYINSFNDIIARAKNNRKIPQIISLKAKSATGSFIQTNIYIKRLRDVDLPVEIQIEKNRYLMVSIIETNNQNDKTLESTGTPHNPIQTFSNQKARKILSSLTKRELQVFSQIGEGLTNQEIAEKLFLAVETVKTHRKNMMSKINLNSTREIIKFCIEHQDIIESFNQKK
jgi:PAS domain S-box-containing protein